ncbi:hypothetical protein [Acaryochloris marina]|uniref:hypothetical protein n=1 Tax=Acaryochloris marina TaxID=155978 RepID=UPI0021C27B9B|nr:hypothetical protein [Acaryochloris marina]
MPQDLVQYINSPFASWMDRNILDRPDSAPSTETGEMAYALVQLDQNHKQQFLESLLLQDTDVYIIDNRGVFDTTQSAIQARLPLH